MNSIIIKKPFVVIVQHKVNVSIIMKMSKITVYSGCNEDEKKKLLFRYFINLNVCIICIIFILKKNPEQLHN